MYLKSIGDCVRSRDESIDTPLDPPFFWLDNIFKEFCHGCFNDQTVIVALHEKDEKGKQGEVALTIKARCQKNLKNQLK